jgi:hypothetical protein
MVSYSNNLLSKLQVHNNTKNQAGLLYYFDTEKCLTDFFTNIVVPNLYFHSMINSWHPVITSIQFYIDKFLLIEINLKSI